MPAFLILTVPQRKRSRKGASERKTRKNLEWVKLKIA